MPLRIFFDGGARPNPGRIEVAAVARGVAYVDRDAGEGGNEAAEWLALLHAARIADEMGASDVEFVGDSVSVIRQAQGRAKCRTDRQRAFRAAFEQSVTGIGRVRLRHVLRSKNLAGIALASGHPR